MMHHPILSSRAAQRKLPAATPISRNVYCAVLAMGLTLGTALLNAPAHAQENTNATNARKAYSIAPGALGETLADFASKAGVTIQIDSSVVEGRRSQGLNGSVSVAEGFARLLAGSGLEAMERSRNIYVLRTAQIESTLPAVTVSAAVAEDATSYTSRTISIGKTDQKLKDIPQSVSVVTRQRMDDQNMTSIYDVLENVTGVVTTASPMAGKYFFARGFPITSIQYDGVPLTRQFYSQASSLTENMALYERAEVLRGAAGLWQGADSMGGAVNLVRKRGQAEKTISATVKAGSYNHYGAQLDVGGPLNESGTVRGRAVLDYDTQDSFIDFVGSKNTTLYGAIDIDLTSQTTLGFGLSYEKTNATPSFAGLPRYADGGSLGLRRSTFLGSDWNELNNQQTRVFADLTHRFNDDWHLKVGAVYMNERNDSVYSYGEGAISRATGTGANMIGVGTDFRGEHVGLDAAISGKFQAWGRRHEVIVGANYSNYTSDDKYAIATGLGPVNVFNPNPYSPRQSMASLAARSGLLATGAYDVTSKGLYGTTRLALSDPLSLIIGGRVSWYENKYDSVSRWGANTTSTKSSAEFTPYMGLTYAITPQWTAYGSYTEVFVPQAQRTAAQQTLDPIVGSNYEIGIKGELFDQRVNTSLALFRYIHKNRAVPDIESGMVCDGDYCSRASGKVRSQGLEAEIGGKLTSRLNLSAGYTYNTTRYLEDTENEGLVFNPQVPKHLMRAWADYRVSESLSAGLGMTTQSDTQGRTKSVVQGGYTLWNARAAYRIDPRWTLALNVNNLFDKHYYATIDRTNFGSVYGNPREVMMTLRGTF
ncbi:outer membrane receptor for ferric coprogen and ferric-rhodotorulic acid [Janthinobacterium sp. Marseille]|nr:outer membrane receptor for ferric coprogen and ferric-rhodotorulic acid [Janthinobacterium sp. Marseille]